MLEIFEDIIVWTVIIAILIIWLAITLLMCLQCVKEECEDGYNAFAGSFIILGGLSSWAAAYFDLPYYLAWGCAGGVIFTLLFVRTSTMREFRNTFLAYFSCTFWGCWIPKHNRAGNGTSSYMSSGEESEIISPYYTPKEREELERHADGLRSYGTTGDPYTSRNSEGQPIDSEGYIDFDTLRAENESYDDLGRSCDSAYD